MSDQTKDPYGPPHWHSVAEIVAARRQAEQANVECLRHSSPRADLANAMTPEKPCRTCEDAMSTPSGECPKDGPCDRYQEWDRSP